MDRPPLQQPIIESVSYDRKEVIDNIHDISVSVFLILSCLVKQIVISFGMTEENIVNINQKHMS